jgi:hypothetical protein
MLSASPLVGKRYHHDKNIGHGAKSPSLSVAKSAALST